MKKMTKEELSELLRKHHLWLMNKPGGEKADLTGADLTGANLYGANNIFFPIACPEKGSFVGYKKASGLIVELLIAPDARRCSATTRKCRCSKAFVVSITKTDGSEAGVMEVASDFDKTFIYKVGEMVEVTNFNDNRWDECSMGIHFFITREEAVRW